MISAALDEDSTIRLTDIGDRLVHSANQEALPNYEQALLRSLARQPSEFGVCMVGRLLNAGIQEVGGISLLDTLRQLAATSQSLRIREAAAGFASRHN
ncbi:hypothetical protein [Burkholderia lata]|uniref:hypothetical protein n=1 Tax=Burkholderia lata (strain ATCC 17760 / DSM 23089 / LMG 22485 / NCIMB 9086 / R18194 / 383) TaxID=482957 RepID=UPI0005A2FA93|nr:hypothetical protein [Burkholderia lata]